MFAARIIWSALGVAALIAVILSCVTWGWGASGLVLLFALFPDVALIGAFAGQGRLKPGRVRFYNALHAPVPALILTGIGVVLLLGAGIWGALLAGLAWVAHIALDRALGYGFRAADGSIIPVDGSGRVYGLCA